MRMKIILLANAFKGDITMVGTMLMYIQFDFVYCFIFVILCFLFFVRCHCVQAGFAALSLSISFGFVVVVSIASFLCHVQSNTFIVSVCIFQILISILFYSISTFSIFRIIADHHLVVAAAAVTLLSFFLFFFSFFINS